MADIWDTLDYDDPCATLAVLRPVYYRLLAGQKVVELQHGDTSTRFDQTNLTQLAEQVRQLTSACKAATTGKTQRHATIAG